MNESEQARIQMCPKCLQEKRTPIGTLRVCIIDGVKRDDLVNCQNHGDYSIDEMYELISLGFEGWWVIAPNQCEYES